MKARMATLKVDDALKAGTDIGPVSSKDQLDQDMQYSQIGKDEGATLASGGDLIKTSSEGHTVSTCRQRRF